jgi:hypothetical protein
MSVGDNARKIGTSNLANNNSTVEFSSLTNKQLKQKYINALNYHNNGGLSSGVVHALTAYKIELDNRGITVLSNAGRRTLKEIELPAAFYDYYVNDSNGKTTHIKFHYAGDRGLTFGWGTYVKILDDNNNPNISEENKSLLKKYGIGDEQIKYLTPLIQGYLKDKSNYNEISRYLSNYKAPLEDCQYYFDERVGIHEERINVLKDGDYKSMNLNNHQVDALIINRYCRGHIYDDLNNALKTGISSNVKLEYFQQPKGYDDRGTTEYNIFHKGEYKYQGNTF